MDTDDVLGPYPSTYVAFDVLISDVKPADLPLNISVALGIPYLSELATRQSPVKGVVFNTKDTTLRVLVVIISLVILHNNDSYNLDMMKEELELSRLSIILFFKDSDGPFLIVASSSSLMMNYLKS